MKTVIPVALLALPLLTIAELAQVQVLLIFLHKLSQNFAKFHYAKKCIYFFIETPYGETCIV